MYIKFLLISASIKTTFEREGPIIGDIPTRNATLRGKRTSAVINIKQISGLFCSTQRMRVLFKTRSSDLKEVERIENEPNQVSMKGFLVQKIPNLCRVNCNHCEHRRGGSGRRFLDVFQKQREVLASCLGVEQSLFLQFNKKQNEALIREAHQGQVAANDWVRPPLIQVTVQTLIFPVCRCKGS